jgi:FOG: TPR repeat
MIVVLIVLLLLACSCARHQVSEASVVIYCNGAAIVKAQGPKSAVAVLRNLIGTLDKNKSCAPDTIDYPFEGSIFPPDIVAPTILWHGQPVDSGIWMMAISFDSSAACIYTLTDGRRIETNRLDSECIRDNNHWEESAYRKSARAWTPDSGLWTMIREKSRERAAHIGLYGIAQAPDGRRVVSHCTLTIQTSKDPVGAPIFYRDVPLMPVRNPNGVIQPLSQDAVPLIAWRLRDISLPSAPVVMKHMPTCINCHSFSSDGRTLGMDMDGPQGDKGAYALVPTAKRICIQQADVFTWNKFNREKNTFGLFSRVSPDGRFVVSAVDEEVHVVNYMDFRFLQTFYPTRGLIAWYDRLTKKITTLPGANDPRYVQCNPVWSPDGKWVAFLRAQARMAFNGPKATFANDPRETQIKYDLYRAPFNSGAGGTAEPVRGASATGKSVSFPKYSPDGKWIVFVQANNGLLMRPDSRLYIIPAGGGEARELQCNMALMNSWHSWSPNGRWLVFSSKAFSPFTQMFLTHIDENGNASPAVLIPNSTAINRAVNLPEFVNIASGGISSILTPAVDYRIHFDIGKNLLDRGNIDSAYAEIMKAVALKPDYAENYSTLAFVLAKQGKMNEAMEASLQAVKRDPANDWIHALAGMLLYAAKKYPESIEHFKLAIKLNPNSAVTRYYYALSLEAVNNTREALENYTRALSIDTAFTDAYNNRGSILYGMHKTEEAIDDFSKAIAITPKVQFYQNRAIAYMYTGEVAKAVADFDFVISRAPGEASAYFNKALCSEKLGDLEAAANNYSLAMRYGQPHTEQYAFAKRRIGELAR